MKLPCQLLNHLIFKFLSPIYFKLHMTSSGHAYLQRVTQRYVACSEVMSDVAVPFMDVVEDFWEGVVSVYGLYRPGD